LLLGQSKSLDPDADAFVANLHQQRSNRFQYQTINNVQNRVLVYPLRTESAFKSRVGVILVATSIEEIIESNRNLIIITAISATICILVSIALGLWLSSHLLKPIKNIQQAAADVAEAEDLSTRLTWVGPIDELGELTEVFNHMMARLEHLFNVQRRFIGDVSHELRTPLTSILGNLELIQKYGFDQSSLDAIYRETLRMSRMVNDLLLLTRSDYGDLELDFYPIDLEELALTVYEEALNRAQKRNLSISIKDIEPVQIIGNGERIRQLMSNLLHNAIKFTDDGGKIMFSVYRQGQDAIIEVQDTGIGISEEHIKRVFDRFFQADPSRIHHDESDGAGLGLSIVSWIVTSHNGTIDVKSTLGEGSRFRVRLPINRTTGNSYQRYGNGNVNKSSSLHIETKPPTKPRPHT
jgi:signal transduction histidine kinase